MKFEQASKELKYALDHQKTITTKKLNKILQDMNFSLTEDQEIREVKYLKGEIKNLHKHIRKMKRK